MLCIYLSERDSERRNTSQGKLEREKTDQPPLPPNPEQGA